MFRDASQPVRSNKPTPTVCVIRLLIVIPSTTLQFKLHPATRSQSSEATFPSAGNLTLRGEAHSEERQRQTCKSQPMATGCSPLSAFVFTSEPLVRKPPSGYRKAASFLVCPLLHKPTPTGHARRSSP